MFIKVIVWLKTENVSAAAGRTYTLYDDGQKHWKYTDQGCNRSDDIWVTFAFRTIKMKLYTVLTVYNRNVHSQCS